MEALGRSKGGFGTKAVGLCDGAGRLLALELLPGQAYELEAVPALFDALPGVPIWIIGEPSLSATLKKRETAPFKIRNRYLRRSASMYGSR